MRLVFAGTPELARTVLLALIATPTHEVVGVITQPDRMVGRHRRTVEPPPVKVAAEEHRIEILQPETLAEPWLGPWLQGLKVEAVAVAAYGKLIPEWLLALPRRGFINVHASLLPRWRGAAPIQRAMLAGDKDTGVCVMQMDAGLDTGPVWACEELDIRPEETAGELTGRVAMAGASLLVGTLDAIEHGIVRAPVAQAEEGATLAAKVGRDDVTLSWNLPVIDLHRRVMAGNPSPGARVETPLGQLKVWRTRIIGGSGVAAPVEQAPGAVISVEPELVIAASSGALALLEVQGAGKDRMRGTDFAHGRRLAPGDTL